MSPVLASPEPYLELVDRLRKAAKGQGLRPDRLLMSEAAEAIEDLYNAGGGYTIPGDLPSDRIDLMADEVTEAGPVGPVREGEEVVDGAEGAEPVGAASPETADVGDATHAQLVRGAHEPSGNEGGTSGYPNGKPSHKKPPAKAKPKRK